MNRPVHPLAPTLALLLPLGGCASIVVEPETVDEDAVAGLVELGYEYGGVERFSGDWESGRLKAEASCRAWGYRSARRLGRPASRCVSESLGIDEETLGVRRAPICLRRAETARFRCTGEGAVAGAEASQPSV